MRKKQRFSGVDTPSGVRLRAARKMASLSMEELARRLGGIVTKQAIAKYEAGRMRPSPEVLERLAQVLDIPPEIPETVSLDAARPRLLPGGSAEKAHYLFSMSEVRAPEKCAGGEAEGKPEERLKRAEGVPPAARPDDLKSQVVVRDIAAANKREPGPLARLFGPRARESRTFGAKVLKDEGRIEHAVLLEEQTLAASEPTVSFEVAPDVEMIRLGRVPESPRLARMAERPLPLDFSSVRFRERGPIPAKLESALRFTIADRMNRLMAVEAMLGARVVFRDPLGGAPAPATATEVERAAAAVRESWGLGESPVPNLLGLLEDKGISVCEVGGFEGFDGLSAGFGSRTVVVVNPDLPADRVRFTAAHELAHLLSVASAGPETAEGLCHEFAGAFLLPRGPLARLMTPAGRKVALADLAELKRTYGISLQAIMRRAHGLGLVTDRQMRRFRETFRDKGWLEAEPVEYHGAEKAVRFRRLLNFAVAEDILDLGRAAALAGVAPEDFRKEMGDVF